MPCILVETDGKITCTVCGRPGRELHRKQMCGCVSDEPKHTCGQPLVRKQRTGQGWWWRCEACHVWAHECRTCNAKQPSIMDLASEHDAVD